MKKILVVRYRFIGDTILTIPFLRNLRRANPDAQIDMIVAPGSGEILKNCPYVNHLIYFDTTRKHKYERSEDSKKSFWHYVRLLRQEKYDKAYVLKRSLSSAMLCFFSGIKERIGYKTELRGLLLTKCLDYDKEKHESLCYLDVLKADGIEIKDTYLENWVTEEETEKVRNLLEANGILQNVPKAVVNITATNDKKIWDIDSFAHIIEFLINQKGVQVIFTGSPEDREVYERIPYNEELKMKPLNLCGAVDLNDSLAIIKEVDFVVGNDTGVLHMAASVNTKCIGLFGPMPVSKWQPLGNNIILQSNLSCVPCKLKGNCPVNTNCMKEISVYSVKRELNSVLENLKQQ